MSMYQNPNFRDRRILGHQELMAVPLEPDDDPIVDVRKYDSSIVAQAKPDTKRITGETLYVRDMVADKLASINSKLGKQSMRLLVTYGYRHPDIQRNYFEEQREAVLDTHPLLLGEELDAYTHNFVALPSVAGHPTGGAVDLTILDSEGEPLDMGTSIADYTEPEKIPTDSPGLRIPQIGNRALLHDVMVDANFAPSYGKWWHFSFGDREWGAFYDAPARYNQIDLQLPDSDDKR